jgi:antitoxin (DNA-binding transcriptional repressor) of toxin-antitoxin stability system
MKTATVGDVQKNFAKMLREIGAGEEITVLKRGIPVAKIAAIVPKGDIDWPDFYDEAIQLDGTSVSQLVLDGREERI